MDHLIPKRKMTVKLLQKLCGFLNFLCRAVLPSRAFTRRLYGALEGKTHLKAHHHFNITGEMQMDLHTWRLFLESPSCFCHPFMDFDKTWHADELDFYTDASRNFSLGMGGYCSQEWFSAPWDRSFMSQKQPSIEFLELFAVATGLLLWLHKFQNRRIVVFVDNQSIMNMLNNNSSGCRHCMSLIRLIVLESLIWNVRVFAKHVKSVDNGIADALSHFQWGRYKRLTKDMDMNEHGCAVPHELWPMEKIWID